MSLVTKSTKRKKVYPPHWKADYISNFDTPSTKNSSSMPSLASTGTMTGYSCLDDFYNRKKIVVVISVDKNLFGF